MSAALPRTGLATGTIAAQRRSARATTAYLIGGILLVALNLRVAITSLGALLDEVSTGLALPAWLASVVTMLPALSFAGFGILTPRLTRWLGPARLLAVAMGVLAIGLLLRAMTGSVVIFLITSALALGGIAVSNVLLPGLVRQLFPTRAGLLTGLYTMVLIAGTSLGAALSVPIADAAGSWRAGLGAWALLAAVAAVPWLVRSLRSGPAFASAPTESGQATVRPARTRFGWAMAIYFGTQSLSGYAIMGWFAQLFRDAGFTAANAGLLLAGVTAAGLPIALLMPTLAHRRNDVRHIILLMSVASTLAYVGLAVAPGLGIVWVLLLAIGQGGFPLALALLGMRAREHANVVALSAFAQSAGYLVGATGPLLVGLLYDATGGWYAPLGFLLVALVIQTISGLYVGRPHYLEDGTTSPLLSRV